ncbi:AraC family transcriptional regulator [Paenibacillus sp.]|uniref:helix-turn-helix domain-containing protein n=1 Tax=Paenibacillus sp. TaxID=58172 RepID=UPI002D51B60F|nr:AraC family transcriptional regulator [Paenibacillus sp.]HZG83367.1 AraC family transcriptional regulator [Paenibacillus sp.]
MIDSDESLEQWLELQNRYIQDLVRRKEEESNQRRKSNIDEIKHFIDQKYMEMLTLDNIANHFYFNKEYLCRAFKRKTGSTVTKYITQKRIEKSIQLLARTSLPIKDIAEAVGYSDLQYFYRLFKKMTQKTPMQVRENPTAFSQYRPTER